MISSEDPATGKTVNATAKAALSNHGGIVKKPFPALISPPLRLLDWRIWTNRRLLRIRHHKDNYPPLGQQ